MREPIGSGPFRLAEPWAGGDAPIRLVAHDASARGGCPVLATPRRHRLPRDPVGRGARGGAAVAAGSISTPCSDPSAFDARRRRARHDRPRDARQPLALARRELPAGAARGPARPSGDHRWPWIGEMLLDAVPRPGNADHPRRRRAMVVGRGARPCLASGPWRPRCGARAPRGSRCRARHAPGDPRGREPADRDPTGRTHRGRSSGPSASTPPSSVVDGATYAARVSRDGDFQLATSYWGSPIWDPDDFVWMGFRSGARYDAGFVLRRRPSTRSWNAAAARSTRRASDGRVRRPPGSWPLDQLPVIPTIQPAMLRGVSARLRGYVPTPCAQLRTLRDTWLA